MNETLIENWNAIVKPGDIVYHLGDFALVRSSEMDKIPLWIKRLHGQKHLILGNHDQKRKKALVGFVEVREYKEIKIDEQKIVLCHFPFKSFNKMHYGSWNLHGHCHGKMPRDYNMMQLDVGVDVWNYRPISYEQVREELKKHKFVPVDHHGKEGM